VGAGQLDSRTAGRQDICWTAGHLLDKDFIFGRLRACVHSGSKLRSLGTRQAL